MLNHIKCLYIFLLTPFCTINAQELNTLIAGSSGAGSIIAVFDYDRRDVNERTVASYIEDKILNHDNKVIVKQFSGGNDNNTSIKVLHHLDSSNYDLIVTITSDALGLARYIVKKTPMLFTNVNNPKFLGINNLSKPGGNISGASYYVPVESQLRFFQEIMPSMKKVGVLFDAKNKSRYVEAGECRDTFKKMHVQFLYKLIDTKLDLPKATQELIDQGVDAIIATSSGVIYNNIYLFKPIADKNNIPIFSFNKKGVKNGAIASLSSDYYLMVDELLIPMIKQVIYESKNPGNMPVGFLSKHIKSINATQAGIIGIEIPKSIIIQADKIF